MPKELAGWPHPNSFSSVYQAQTSGIPQGPTLGPMLLIIFSKETDCGIWILPLQSALVTSHLKCWELNNDVDLLERAQGTSPMKKGCESWDCSAWRRALSFLLQPFST